MAKVIIFDCDSTLSSIEGVDELARFKGDKIFAQVEQLTRQAMEGEIPLEEVFRRRMDLIRPSQGDLDHIATQYKATLAAGVRQVVSGLQTEGWTVVVVSGGLYPPVKALADDLGIADVMAVPVSFDVDGNYMDFDDQYWTARSGGKPECIARIKTRYTPATIVMVGDGVSDLETRPVVDHFIGYGEFTVRDKVKQGAEHFVMSMSELSDVLKSLAT